jgi:ABC-type bacteriocin/lantibiotic exporter with double-glycine peptidase domain
MISLRRVRVRPIQQMEAAECGVACLTMLLDYHGHRATLGEVRGACGTSRDGNNAWQLLEGGKRHGLEGRGRRSSLEKLAAVRCPALLHWDMNHFVVLEAVAPDGIRIVDPASGRRFAPAAEVDALFSGIALELWPGPTFQRRRARTRSFRRYWSALGQAKGALLFVLAANLARQLLAVLAPAASQVLIDHVILPNRGDWVLPILAALALATLGQLVLGYLQGTSQALLQGILNLELTLGFGRRLLNLPLDFIESRSRGDLLQRVEIQAQLQGLISQTAHAAFDLVLVLLLGALMLAYDWRLAALTLTLIAGRICVLARSRAASAQRVASELAARGREQGVLLEAASCPELIRGLAFEARVLRRYEQRLTERAEFGIASARLQLLLSGCLTALGGASEAAILWFGGQRVIAGAISLGVFAGFLTIRSLLEPPLVSLLTLFESWIRFRSVLERSEDVLCVTPVGDGQQQLDQPRGALELREVSFRYGSGGAWVLREVNLCIEPGERVALVGPSGQGKSTLIKLMCGLLEPNSGEILLDGLPLRSYERRSLATHMGVVLQEPLVLEGTVADALCLRDPDAGIPALAAAAERACFDEVVARLPGGYGARLAAAGANLSGGERQRLALAQALLGPPALLFLDEATCALDLDTERRVLDRLAGLAATTISVAHRASVIERAHRILTVMQGSVREMPAPHADHPLPWNGSAGLQDAWG